MNPFEMVVLIVAITAIASIFRAKYLSRHEGRRDEQVAETAENARLRDEVKQLKERLAVLERITVDKENSLAREIDQLRER